MRTRGTAGARLSDFLTSVGTVSLWVRLQIRTACVRSVVRVRMCSELLFRIRLAEFRVRLH
jgi:hypothetical protein